MSRLLGRVAGECSRVLSTARLYPCALMTYCLYMAWQSFMLLRPVFGAFPPGGVAGAVVVPYALMGVSCLAISLAFKRWRFVFDRLEHRVLVCAAMTVGTLCQLACSLWGDRGGDVSFWVVYLLGWLLGAQGVALFRVEMDRVFGWIGAEKTLHVIAVGTLLNCPVVLAMTALPVPVGYAVASLLPVAATACLCVQVRSFPKERYYGIDRDLELPLPTQFVMTSFVQGVANGVFYALAMLGFAGIGSVFADGALLPVSWMGGVAVTYAATFFLRMDYNRLVYKVGFPLLALSFVVGALAPSAGAGLVGGTLFYMAAVYTDLVLWSLGAFIMRDMGMPACWIASFPGAALFGGTALGAAAVSMLLEAVGYDGGACTTTSLLMACLMLGASLALLSEKNLRSGWGTFRIGTRDGLATGLDVALAHIATEYGLTAREAEVVRAFAGGLARRDVAESLGVGDETVKTHLRSVYRKLGVHAQAELVDFVEAQRRAINGE